jgi:hypothetical protein
MMLPVGRHALESPALEISPLTLPDHGDQSGANSGEHGGLEADSARSR